jgi:hypothetical protein
VSYAVTFINVINAEVTGELGFDFQQERWFVFFFTASRSFWGPPSLISHNQWIQDPLTLGVKWPGHGADCSALSSAEVNNA